jgi:hypothetical protein
VTDEQILEIKKRGCVVITGGITSEVLSGLLHTPSSQADSSLKEALTWKRSIQEYAATNKDLVKGVLIYIGIIYVEIFNRW